jgi:hypothetical protein
MSTEMVALLAGVQSGPFGQLLIKRFDDGRIFGLRGNGGKVGDSGTAGFAQRIAKADLLSA